MNSMGVKRSLVAVALGLAACTLRVDKVDVPQPKITIQCVIVELPGGGVIVRDCDGGPAQDSGE